MSGARSQPRVWRAVRAGRTFFPCVWRGARSRSASLVFGHPLSFPFVSTRSQCVWQVCACGEGVRVRHLCRAETSRSGGGGWVLPPCVNAQSERPVH